MQTFMFNSFKKAVDDGLAKQHLNMAQTLGLAAFYVNGYGTPPDYQNALSLLHKLAGCGHVISRAYLYRITVALATDFTPDASYVAALHEPSILGCRKALEDLETLDPNAAASVKQFMRENCAGIGAAFFGIPQLLHGKSIENWKSALDGAESLSQLVVELGPLETIKVNKRGDGIIHMAASFGKDVAVEIILDSNMVPIDQVNDVGETALLCACRAGQFKTAELLLTRGADVRITPSSCESPLHWLCSFQGEEMNTIGQALLAGGADPLLLTTRPICHTAFPGGFDVDHDASSNPLYWAVHRNRPDVVRFLLEGVNDPRQCFASVGRGRPTPLNWAAFMHHKECLEIMVEYIGRRMERTTYTVGDLFVAATQSADLFSMTLRHGKSYQENLRQTFDYLLTRFCDVTFSTGLRGGTLLYYAVSRGYDFVVGYLLSDHVKKLLESIFHGPLDLHLSTKIGAYHPSDINRPCGDDQRTPLLEAVRVKRKALVNLLLSAGANPKVQSRNPFQPGKSNFSAIHVFAQAGHDEDFEILEALLSSHGLSSDGRDPDDTEVETPLTVAVQNNSFKLCDFLISHGANPNSLSTSSGLIATAYPTTVLGQVIASAAHNSTSRIEYLLFRCAAAEEIEFVVEPTRNLTALHFAALAHTYLRSAVDNSSLERSDFSWDHNRTIIQRLLERWDKPEDIDRVCGLSGRTALHLAVATRNLGAVQELLARGASNNILDNDGLSAVDLSNVQQSADGSEREEFEEIARLVVGA